jgi:hypothetical protein
MGIPIEINTNNSNLTTIAIYTIIRVTDYNIEKKEVLKIDEHIPNLFKTS